MGAVLLVIITAFVRVGYKSQQISERSLASLKQECRRWNLAMIFQVSQ
jgi:hypothetical protein